MKLFYSVIMAFLLAFNSAQPAWAKNTTIKHAVEKSINVNVNRAGAKEIASALKGIGLKKAEAIVAYREKHGKFKAVEEIASVKGIGVATIAKNSGRISIK